MQDSAVSVIPCPTLGKPRQSRRKRILVKWLIAVSLVLVVLNPNLKRAVLQVKHTLHPDTLIQPHFSGIERVNAQIDRWIAADRGRHSEARLVARFVVRQIAYVTDYENWGNLEYWPTAQEAWQKGQEDCDGRAVLATSLLRSRGYHSARLIVGLDHMWIKVDENEKDPVKPPHYVALLNPNPNFSLDLPDHPDSHDLWCLVQAFLHPTALRETSTQFVADIPLVRKVILVVAALLLCSYPSRRLIGPLIGIALGLLSVWVLADWDPDRGDWLRAGLSAGLFLAASAIALLWERFPRCWTTARHPITPTETCGWCSTHSRAPQN